MGRCELLADLWGCADPGGTELQGSSCVAQKGVGLMLLGTTVSSTDRKEEVSSVQARAAAQGLQGAVGGLPLNGTLLGLASLSQTSVPAKSFQKPHFLVVVLPSSPFKNKIAKQTFVASSLWD